MLIFISIATDPADNGPLSAALMVQAQKHCKHASSALQYDDVSTAIDNLENALRILKAK